MKEWMKFVIEAEKQICLFSFNHGNSYEITRFFFEAIKCTW